MSNQCTRGLVVQALVYVEGSVEQMGTRHFTILPPSLYHHAFNIFAHF